MKKIISTIFLITILILNVNTIFAREFIDTENSFAKSEIDTWTTFEVFKGYDDETFRPDNYITSGEAVTIVDNIFKYNETAENTFTDVSESDWYYNAVLKNLKEGNITGGGEFRGNEFATREQVAVMFAKAFKIKPEGENTGFVDNTDIDPASRGYINALLKKNYIVGREDNMFCPKEKITRAETVMLLNNLCKKIYFLPFITGSYSDNIDGNVVINTSKIVIKNCVINGDLYLSPSIADATVTFDNVTINGSVFVLGKNIANFNLINGSKIKAVNIQKIPAQPVTMNVAEECSLTDFNLNNSINLTISGSGDYKNVTVHSKSNITVKPGVIIENLIANAGVELKNDGTRIIFANIKEGVPSFKTYGVGVIYNIIMDNLVADVDMRVEKLIVNKVEPQLKITDKVFKVQDIKGNDVKTTYLPPAPEPEKVVLDTTPDSATLPVLSTGGIKEISAGKVDVQFRSNVFGTYYYKVYPIISDEPEIFDIVDQGTAVEMLEGINTIHLTGISGCNRLLIVAKNDNGDITRKYINFKIYDNSRYVNGSTTLSERTRINETQDKITVNVTAEYDNCKIYYVALPYSRTIFGDMTNWTTKFGRDTKNALAFDYELEDDEQYLQGYDGNFRLSGKTGSFEFTGDKDTDYVVYAVVSKNNQYESEVISLPVSKLGQSE